MSRSIQSVSQNIQRLERRHSDLKAQVARLDERRHLSEQEQHERAELKKQKLATKDRISGLRER